MRNHNLVLRTFAASFCMLLAGCATTHVPSDWLSKPEQAQSEAYGGWIDILSHGTRIGGELIAIGDDTVFVADSSLHPVAINNILSARLVTYDAPSLAPAVIAGTLSTGSNGWYLVFTAPLWLLGGTAATVARSFEPIIDYPGKPLPGFRPYARYPQGLPSAVDRSIIRMKTRSR